jgi:plasmid stabilization system protein ParE
MMEPLRLVGDAARDLLDIAGDISEFDAEAADAVGELVDQPFGQRPVR